MLAHLLACERPVSCSCTPSTVVGRDLAELNNAELNKHLLHKWRHINLETGKASNPERSDTHLACLNISVMILLFAVKAPNTLEALLYLFP